MRNVTEKHGYTAEALQELAHEQVQAYNGEEYDLLEIVYIKRNDVLDSIELLLAFGGPDIRMTIRDNEWAVVELNWWGDRIATEIYDVELPSMFAWFEER